MLMILIFTLSVIRHLICDNNQNWLLNLNLIYKALWTGAESGLLIPTLEKFNLFHLTSVITLVLLIWKWVHLLFRKNHLLRCWGWHSLLNWIGALTISLSIKLPPKNWSLSMKLFLLRLLCISIYLPFNHAWNNVVMSGLVLLVTFWNCWMGYKNRYVGLLVLLFLPLLNPWLIFEISLPA